MKYFVFLNEFTLLRTLVLVLLGRPVYLIPSRPFFAPLTGLFVRITARLEKRAKVGSVFDVLPDTRKYWNILY